MEPHDAIYLLTTATETVSITNSGNGATKNVFEHILKVMVADTDKYLLLAIDLTFCKMLQHATGTRKVLGEQAIRVSRGGKNTKIHALVTENFQHRIAPERRTHTRLGMCY